MCRGEVLRVRMTEVPHPIATFSLTDYAAFLGRLRDQGIQIRKVEDLAAPRARRQIFLRHDVDFSLELSLPMAQVEFQAGIQSTYFVLLNGPYDPFEPENRARIRQLCAWGHEVGLHYDLSQYPVDPDEQFHRLLAETERLESVIGMPIRSISMHEPHRNGKDPFRTSRWIHPHNDELMKGVAYVSDSCRAWRDNALLNAFESDVQMQWLTHPELWLDGALLNRLEYLRERILPNIPERHREYFEIQVPAIWSQHIGPWKHDQRTALQNRNCAFLSGTREHVTANLESILALFKDAPEVPWGEKEVLLELPEKWELSQILLQHQQVVGIAINSWRDSALYVHAIVTRRELRRSGLGTLLLKQLKIIARERGMPIRLRVGEPNVAAHRWYLNEGFRVVAQEPEQAQCVLEWNGP